MSIQPVQKPDTEEKFVGTPLVRSKKFYDLREVYQSSLESLKKEKKESENE